MTQLRRNIIKRETTVPLFDRPNNRVITIVTIKKYDRFDGIERQTPHMKYER